jgi:hypothetical protein
VFFGVCDHKWVKRFVRLIHTRLRHSSNSLNADFFRVHLANDPGCICGCAFNDANHFILECVKLYRFENLQILQHLS